MIVLTANIISFLLLFFVGVFVFCLALQWVSNIKEKAAKNTNFFIGDWFYGAVVVVFLILLILEQGGKL